VCCENAFDHLIGMSVALNTKRWHGQILLLVAVQTAIGYFTDFHIGFTACRWAQFLLVAAIVRTRGSNASATAVFFSRGEPTARVIVALLTVIVMCGHCVVADTWPLFILFMEPARAAPLSIRLINDVAVAILHVIALLPFKTATENT
jgi:F0F1-type ATP synthase assembly protein I